MKLHVSNGNIYKIVDVSAITTVHGKRKLYAKSSFSYEDFIKINDSILDDIMYGAARGTVTDKFAEYKFDISVTFNDEERAENRLKGKPAYKNIWVCGAYVTCVYPSNETDNYDIELCADTVRGNYE